MSFLIVDISDVFSSYAFSEVDTSSADAEIFISSRFIYVYSNKNNLYAQYILRRKIHHLVM